MRKMESYTYKKWNKMWRLWKAHRLDSPLEELALIGMSVLYSFLSFFIKHKNMKVASHIFAICSIGFFLLVLFLASLVSRDY